ncbi:MAG: TIGR00282 family metallophosphoesterase [Acidobacteria bacterium]|nr:TIGR00282 family metallophosphoesterase [Acidobacteriota bacterium]
MKALFIGDIVGSPGRRIVAESVRELAEEHGAELVVANCENAAAGFGITPALVEELLEVGIDVLTSGNHIFDRKEILPFFEQGAGDGRLLRPANYPAPAPGTGLYSGQTRRGTPYAVMNIQGRVFMPSIDCPFRTVDRLLEGLPARIKVILVDAHAETTSEKQALGWHLDGRVSAVLGTHTHVPTADEKILPGGTAYITDVGMTGPYESVIGNAKEDVLRRFLTGLPARLDVAKGDVRLCGTVLDIDETTGRARSIQRLALDENRR